MGIVVVVVGVLVCHRGHDASKGRLLPAICDWNLQADGLKARPSEAWDLPGVFREVLALKEREGGARAMERKKKPGNKQCLFPSRPNMG
jgi:hypothetical protein